jgi:hypothetical protein
MKISEIITEGAQERVINPEHESVLGHAHTLPGQNLYHGSGYLHSRFIRALAGAGAGTTPSTNMGDENWAAGDPVIKPYHPVEEEMIDNAIRHVGDKNRKKWGNSRSEEPENVHKISPVKGENYTANMSNVLEGRLR